MERVVIHPKRSEWKALSIGLIALCAVMMLLPPLCAPLALVLPLLSCPLTGRKEEPAAWIAAAVPAASSLLAGYDALYALSLLLVGALPLALTKWCKKRTGADGLLWYTGAMALAVTAVLTAATHALGAPLWKTLSEAIVQLVGQSSQAERILLQAASSGLLTVPAGYQTEGLLGAAMAASHKQQMLMSLRLTLEATLYSQLPGLVVQACLITGVFTHLRILRFGGAVLLVQTVTPSERKTTVAVPLGFRMLALPRAARWPLMALAAVSLLLITTPGTYAQTLGQLCFALFEQVFIIIGAAVMIHVFCRHDPDRKTSSGVIAAVIYVMAPFALFLIGVMDQFMHFRKPSEKTENP